MGKNGMRQSQVRYRTYTYDVQIRDRRSTAGKPAGTGPLRTRTNWWASTGSWATYRITYYCSGYMDSTYRRCVVERSEIRPTSPDPLGL